MSKGVPLNRSRSKYRKAGEIFTPIPLQNLSYEPQAPSRMPLSEIADKYGGNTFDRAPSTASAGDMAKAIAESERKAVTEKEGFGEYDAGYLKPGETSVEKTIASGRPFINLDNVLYPELVENKTRSIEQIGKYDGYQGFTELTGSIGKAGIERAAAHLNISPQEAAQRAQDQGTTLGPEAASAYGSAPALTPWTSPRSTSPDDITTYINVGGQANEGYMGQAAVDRSLAAGLSPEEIKKQAAAQGLQFGPNVSL